MSVAIYAHGPLVAYFRSSFALHWKHLERDYCIMFWGSVLLPPFKQLRAICLSSFSLIFQKECDFIEVTHLVFIFISNVPVIPSCWVPLFKNNIVRISSLTTYLKKSCYVHSTSRIITGNKNPEIRGLLEAFWHWIRENNTLPASGNLMDLHLILSSVK